MRQARITELIYNNGDAHFNLSAVRHSLPVSVALRYITLVNIVKSINIISIINRYVASIPLLVYAILKNFVVKEYLLKSNMLYVVWMPMVSDHFFQTSITTYRIILQIPEILVGFFLLQNIFFLLQKYLKQKLEFVLGIKTWNFRWKCWFFLSSDMDL